MLSLSTFSEFVGDSDPVEELVDISVQKGAKTIRAKGMCEIAITTRPSIYRETDQQYPTLQDQNMTPLNRKQKQTTQLHATINLIEQKLNIDLTIATHHILLNRPKHELTKLRNRRT